MTSGRFMGTFHKKVPTFVGPPCVTAEKIVVVVCVCDELIASNSKGRVSCCK